MLKLPHLKVDALSSKLWVGRSNRDALQECRARESRCIGTNNRPGITWKSSL